MPSSSDEPKIVKIGGGKLCNTIFSASVLIGFTIFYTITYAEVSPDIKDTTFYRCFLAYIILSWCAVLIHGFTIKNIIEYYGQTMPESIWEKLQDVNRYPYSFLKLSHWGSLGIGCYFMSIFIPYRDCSAYDDILFGYTNSCVAMKMISFFTIFSLCMIGFVILCLSCLGCCYCYCCFVCVSDSNVRRESGFNVSFARNYLNTYVPISIPSSDTECSICKVSVAENGTDPWTALDCKHNFHSKCVTEWMKYKTTCPLCRTNIPQPQSYGSSAV